MAAAARGEAEVGRGKREEGRRRLAREELGVEGRRRVGEGGRGAPAGEKEDEWRRWGKRRRGAGGGAGGGQEGRRRLAREELGAPAGEKEDEWRR